ncbi:tyrosine-type recombinase/integrase [Streptomyces sp. NBC_01601]|uniref:tyrosine-type recombinase/integrase n=1 Tax=Streptomyces sp. NBC_01601 TaxID=2975892 RepID=UPI002E2B0EDC|nr:tyrosine-type recombinase/integrase [Streptomyces sp. NBC_01601]
MPRPDLVQRPAGEVMRPTTRAEDAFVKIREDLGQVAPRDPVKRTLGPRRYRMDILRDICTAEAFTTVMNWLASSTIPSINSKRNYADDLRFWHQFAQELGHERFYIGCIGRGDVTTWRLSEEQRERADRSIARRLSALSSLTAFAAEESQTFIPNPVTRHNRPKIDRHDETTATPMLEVEEFGALFDWAECLRDVVVTSLVYVFAGRVSEWCEADVTDFRDGRKPVIDLTRKGNKGRQWDVPHMLAELLVLLINGRTKGPLLLDSEDRRLDRHDVDRILTRLGKRAGVLTGRDLTPHVLRVSRLTHMHDDGTPLEEIQEFAGHDDPATTLSYIRRRGDQERRARHAAAGVDKFSTQLGRWIALAA